ncbi:MAG: hypothetical protein U0271_10070 [Polyangiaceae bacterium]
MSGGLAFVWDRTGALALRVNPEMVRLTTLTEADEDFVLATVNRHIDSPVACSGGASSTAGPPRRPSSSKVLPLRLERVH